MPKVQAAALTILGTGVRGGPQAAHTGLLPSPAKASNCHTMEDAYGAPVEVFTLAQAYYMGKQYRRALMLLKRSELVDADVRFRYLAARCLAECHDWEECLAMLGGWENEEADNMDMQDVQTDFDIGQEVSIYAAMCLVRGRAYDALENRTRAIRWYRAALRADPYCYEAFQVLVDNHMLTSEEEAEMRLQQKFPEENSWLELLYRAKCKKYDQQDTIAATLEELERPALPSTSDEAEGPSDAPQAGHGGPKFPATPASRPQEMPAESRMSVDGRRTRSMRSLATPSGPVGNGLASAEGGGADVVMRGPADDAEEAALGPGCGLANNLDVLVCRAEWYYHLGAFRECYQLTSSVLESDPYAMEAFPVHLAAALELRKKNELFLRSHRLVEEYPDRALSWYAVGCYYLCTQQYENARRYFGKATSLDASFAPAWVGFGHAFAFQDESDQAMASYRTATRLFPGLHLPLVGMGMEYQRMNNLHLADLLFLQAHKICPTDPLVCNELGVLAYRNRHYDQAERWLQRALDRVPGRLSAVWEPTIVNLAHTYRKQRRWAEAMEAYEKALGLNPGQPGTYAALGYTYHLQGNSSAAIEHYHKALGLRPEDTFTAEMLTVALQEGCMREDNF
ncbi:hypothetical protein WJX72_006697 [[Myrmecia] bisecta]|uniref:Uncharacterized protein n=1 Tax=[Myrmecia] bisecta TaxID=41462 RepID=A0AAW1QR94_9CHLO